MNKMLRHNFLVLLIFLVFLGSSMTQFGNAQSTEEILFEKAIQAINEQKYEEAISIFDNILSLDPNNIATLNNKGIALVELENYNEAIDVFEKILEVEPNNEKALKNRDAVFKNIDLIPYYESKYLGHVQIQVRSEQGNLVSITETDALKFLAHPLTDEFLNAIPLTEIVEKDGIMYEKKEIITSFTAQEDTFFSSTRLVSDKFGGNVIVVFTLNHAYTVEPGDKITAHWTVLRDQ